MARLFGTDGVRGVAGEDLTCQTAFELGRAGATVLTQGTRHPKILVGRDTRISGSMLENALVSGICAVGGDAYVVGVIPTPGIAYLTRLYGCDAGVVISASHNPYEFNGIKFFNRDGFKLPDAVEDAIELLMNHPQELPPCSGRHVGTVRQMVTAAHDYTTFLSSLVDKNLDLTGIKVVMDCANGAASVIAPQLYVGMGADVMSIYDHPNGCNINDKCGSTHMETLMSIVKSLNADVGLAFDGDADRLLVVNSQGEQVDGDQIMMMLACYFQREGRLKKDTLVSTVMSNMGLKLAAERRGIHLETTRVGDRYVLETMLEKGYNLGGEQSGHIIILDESTTGDGILTSLHLMQLMAKTGQSIRELSSAMTVLPQVLVNLTVRVERKDDWQRDEEITRRIADLEASYQGTGRVLVRASGTEPLIRVMIEGEDSHRIGEDAAKLADLIKERLG